MKKLLSILFFTTAFQFSFAAELIISGHYQGYNLFILNPEYETEPITFCVQKVSVNGIEIPHNHSSAFEIQLDSLGFLIGDSLLIILTHHDDCKPRVLNTEPSTRINNYTLLSIQINEDKILTWTTTNEKGKLPYIIEQYRWNKWVKVGEVDGLGALTENKYEFQIIPHSGKNRIRVCQIDADGTKKPSAEVIFISTEPIVKITVSNIDKQIICTAETLYEIYDDKGNMIKRGYAKQIDCSDLKNGIYFLNFDNQNVKVVFKKNKAKN